MRMSHGGLKTVLSDSVVEVKFIRRLPKQGHPMSRRMLCTNAGKLLNSIEGQVALRYRPPHSTLPYSADAKGLITVWDIMWASYRNIPSMACDVVSVMPVRTDEDLEKFWEYFRQFLSKLDPNARAAFGDM